jgi:segregation and condensation protein A
MTYQVKTDVFEGPLDLLLQLITRHQVEVTAVNLTDLVREYVSYISEMRTLDLDVTSEFLLIAATLLQLKARELLPTNAELDLDEELALMEERDKLLSRLLACVTFKDVAAVLALRFENGHRYIARLTGITDEVSARPPSVRVGLDAAGLATLADMVLQRPSEPDLDHLDLELPSVELAIADIRLRVENVAELTFEDVVERCTRQVEVAAYFLALLELARWGFVEVAQDTWLSPIHIRQVQGLVALPGAV